MAEINSEINEKQKVSDRPTVVRNATDLQRLKLEKLMKNPDKPILIPERPKERGMPAVPEFVRNVMGSSAGAGSGEFHVYRHLRRKEYARQKFMKERGERERLEDEYHQKLEDNKRKAEEKTAKKRAKRLKRKQKMKTKKTMSKPDQKSSESDSEEEDDENESDDENLEVEENVSKLVTESINKSDSDDNKISSKSEITKEENEVKSASDLEEN
ncbi:hypothetical protein ILUMI_03143 [Ignelater luminosus]|uniref:PRKR-interacting protein 1 n=1 Tax=Ignelater luminosus TaxID=2038154 RepID=A0A8K0GKR0_IGNLU|nr:hypothetical protein ILUMI_03143 [Ignelater luminosus]